MTTAFAPCRPAPAGAHRGVHQAFTAGRAAVLVDESGAILAFPAATATTSQLHFAITHSSGLIHAAMTAARLDALRVPDQPMLASEDSGLSFTVSVDATTGIGTGISARDRAHTLRVLADPHTVPDDLTRPGHILPIRCADGGHAERPRPWELAVDLVRAAGLPPVAVTCRLIGEDGDVLDPVAATVFALCHDLPVCTCPLPRV